MRLELANLFIKLRRWLRLRFAANLFALLTSEVGQTRWDWRWA